MDSIYMNAVSQFSRFEPDIEETDNGSLFYPEIKAYIRCGDLSPKKLFELIEKDGCERVIIFGNGLLYNKEQSWEVFHSFEMLAPKEYIMEKLAKMREEQLRTFAAALEATGANDVFKNIIPTVYNEEQNNTQAAFLKTNAKCTSEIGKCTKCTRESRNAPENLGKCTKCTSQIGYCPQRI